MKQYEDELMQKIVLAMSEIMEDAELLPQDLGIVSAMLALQNMATLDRIFTDPSLAGMDQYYSKEVCAKAAKVHQEYSDLYLDLLNRYHTQYKELLHTGCSNMSRTKN